MNWVLNPNHRTIYGYYAAWRDEGIFAKLNYDLTGLARVKAGRAAQPSAAVIDTQSVKTSTNPPVATQGTDAAKRIVGRKRSVATDALGLLLAVIVCAASASENQAGTRVLNQAKAIYPTLTKTWVDAGFKTQFVEHARTRLLARPPRERVERLRLARAPRPGVNSVGSVRGRRHPRWVARRPHSRTVAVLDRPHDAQMRADETGWAGLERSPSVSGTSTVRFPSGLIEARWTSCAGGTALTWRFALETRVGDRRFGCGTRAYSNKIPSI